MPMYTYQCYHCGHRFEEMMPASQRQDTLSCTQCDEEAEQLVPESLDYAFDLGNESPVPAPQNTGVASYDYDYDRVIGESARQNYEVIEQREALKREVLRQNPGATMKDLARTIDGDYVVVPREHRQAGAKGRARAEAIRMKAQAFLGEGGEVVDHNSRIYNRFQGE